MQTPPTSAEPSETKRALPVIQRLEPMPTRKSTSESPKPVNLKVLAEYLSLSPATISLVMNNAPGASAIAATTRHRVLEAAKLLNYRPNPIARSLRTRQTYTVGVIVPEFSEGYFTMLMNGIEEHLLQSGYLHFVVSHQGKPDLIDEYPRLLTERSVDGFLLVNTGLNEELVPPVVSISGHEKIKGNTNIMLDHDRAALLALKHLYDLGHRRIAFMKGQDQVSDSNFRWEGIRTMAQRVGLKIYPELCVYLETNSWSPELGYPITRDLLARTRDFTAIFCFNDIAAIGAMRAICDAGLRCPDDISVIGFDDISSAAYQIPRLTTVRQPLRRMGEIAVQTLLKRIQAPNEAYPEIIMFEPELMVRESTSAARLIDLPQAPARTAAKSRPRKPNKK
jgi:DNA-binding LacI/PurR family transcriptional regulator